MLFINMSRMGDTFEKGNEGQRNEVNFIITQVSVDDDASVKGYLIEVFDAASF